MSRGDADMSNRTPAIFIFQLTDDQRLEYVRTHETSSNVIHMIPMPSFGSIIYCMDPLHAPFSTTHMNNDAELATRSCVSTLLVYPDEEQYQVDSRLLQETTSSANAVVRKYPSQEAAADVSKGKTLEELLYGLESLRKRENEANEDQNT